MLARRRETVRILLLSANPLDTATLRLGQEAREIEEALDRAHVRAVVRPVTAVRPGDIPRKLRKFRPNFVHFSGHGESDKGIILEDDNGRRSPLPREALASLFSIYKGVKCVILNSCHSAVQAELISQFVPYVIGMKAAISDKAAIKFSGGFYQSIGDGDSIETAFDYGRWAIQSADLSDAAVPELFRGSIKNNIGQPSQSGHTDGPPVRSSPPETLRSAAEEAVRIPSEHELGELSWEEFEKFSLRVIEAIYRGTNINFTTVRHSVAGERGGEAQYILGIGLERDLQISFRVWLELTQKRERNVSKTDVTHLVNELTDNIDKIIIVTNKTFSPAVQSWLGDFASRANLQFQLFDGQALLQQAQNFLAPHRDLNTKAAPPSAHDVTLVYWYALSPLDGRPASLHRAPVTSRSDRPLFLIVDARLSGDSQPCQMSIKAKSPAGEGLTIHQWPAHSPPKDLLVSAGEQVRQTFIIWPGSCSEEDLNGVLLEVDADRPLTVEIAQLNSVKLPLVVLADTRLQSQSRVADSINQAIDRWRSGGTFFSGLLIAPPGLGKSRIVARIRQRCYAESMHEVFMDCESVKTDVDFIRYLFRALLPVPPTLLDRDLIEPIREWCIDSGIARETAEQVAQDLCIGTSDESRIGVGNRLEIATAIIAFASGQRPLWLIIEDLHKAAPSLLSLLAAVASHFSTAGESAVLFFASTRPLYSGTANLRADWLAALSSISSSDQSMVCELEPPSRGEAREILQASISGLEEYQADMILQAVGATPYAAREAALFLLVKGILAKIDFKGRRALTISEPTHLHLAASSDELTRATESRLRLLLENEPDWLRLLLLGGAAYGRRFPLSTLLEALRLKDDLSLAYALDTCSAWSILSPSSDGAALLEFDHDLVRESILVLGPARARKTVSAAMLEALGPSVDPHVQCRLAYQAGLAELCLQAAQTSKDQARAEGRSADIVEFNQLLIQLFDSKIAEEILSELLKTGDQNLIDPALRNIAPPSLAFLSPEKRLRTVLDLLLENIECLSTVANGSSGAAEAAITEARMIAERLRDTKAIAQLMYLEGRMWFERNSLQRALALHQQAEELFFQIGCSRDSSRAENLIRQAICLRRGGLIEESIALLWRAARLRPLGNWSLLNRVRSNLGAAFLYTDWSMVRYHWEKQIRQAVRRNLSSRRVHALAGLCFIDLFEGRLSEGFERAKEALELGERLRLDGQILRLCLHLSVHSILTDRIQEARTYLVKAEELAMRHGVGRRLWRVTANLATVDELLGDSERAFTRDSQALRQLADAFPELLLNGREMLPFVNIVLRATRDSAFERLRQSIPERFLSAAESYSSLILNGQKHDLPGLLGNYCAELSVGPRLLLSE